VWYNHHDMKHRKTIPLFLLLLFVVSTHALSQDVLTGMVADSATMQPMPNVNVRVKNSNRIAVTDIRGYFTLNASDEDTVIFSMVGYRPKSRKAKLVREVVIIFLKEEFKTLNPVVIDAEQTPPWLPKIPAESPWQNPTQHKSFLETPGFQGVQTFGPGYVLKGPISRFSKYEKERKKHKIVERENYKSRNYVEIVNSPEVKDRIMKDFSLTEEDYYRLLAIFNEKNKDIIYELEPNELISLLLIHYGQNKK
jgi:hypothetical protein